MHNHSFVRPISLAVLLLSVLTVGCDKVSNSNSVAVASSEKTAPVEQTPTKQKAVSTTKYDIKNVKTSSLSFDSTKWKQQEPEKDGRVEFVHTTGEGYASIISERPQMTLKMLREAALENAKKVSPDARIVSEEKRTINGREVMRLEMKATIQEIPFAYIGYYFTGKEGTVQVLTFTTENLLSDYRADFEEFLNGFTVQG